MTRKRGTMLIALLFLYLLITVGYSLLPGTVREGIRLRVPGLDRLLLQRGYALLQGWDELALTGHDAEVTLDKSYRGEQVYGGIPRSERVAFEVLKNKGYVAGYSETMQNPLWVAYRLFDVPQLESGERPSRFQTDRRTKAKVRHDDYTNSGFDRGHMAPNYGIATRYGPDAQKETFLMSNIIPQTPYINRHLWKDLEMRVAQKYGRYFTEVWVITGPIFKRENRSLESGVPVPSAYYKIIVDEHDGKLRALAFLVPERCPPYSRIKTCLVSIDEIEARTALDFFADLPNDVEEQLESTRATRLWPWLGSAFHYQLSGKTN